MTIFDLCVSFQEKLEIFEPFEFRRTRYVPKRKIDPLKNKQTKQKKTTTTTKPLLARIFHFSNVRYLRIV